MNITENLIRISNAKASIRESIINKGVAVSDSALLDEYPALIDSIGLINAYKDLYDMRTNNGTNMAGLFARTSGELDLRKVDVSNVTSMKYMFDNSSASVNIDGWDTSKVTNMYSMFYYFSGSIDISKLDISSVTNVNNMFYQANTDKIILTGLSFPNTTSLDNMFGYAKGATLDLSSWDISNITSMSNMFSSVNYKRIDLTGWKTTNVTSMYNMFSTYSNPLEELIIPDWDMSNCSDNIFYSSSYITKLKLIDLSRSNDTTITKIASFLPTRTATTYGTVIVPSNTSQATYDALMAKYWRPIGADLGPVPTSIEIVSELDELVLGINNSTRVGLNNWDPWFADTSKVELVILDESIATIEGDTINSTGVPGDIVLEARIIDTQEVIRTKTIPVSETDSYPNVIKLRLIAPPSYNTVITVNGSNKTPSNLTYDSIFDIYSYDAGVPITSIKFSNYLGEIVKLDTSIITSMENMFKNCINLTSLDVSKLDTSNVTNMREMFNSCINLTSLDVSNFDTSNVTTMYYMFNYCNNLTSLDVSNFDTSNVKNMANMFSNCSNLTSLDLSNWDTNNVTSMNMMFKDCSSLTELNCSSWVVTSVSDLYDTFDGCTSLVDFYPPQNINSLLDVSYSTKLSHDSLVRIINNLMTTTSILILGATNLAKLSDEEKAIATNKGWELR